MNHDPPNMITNLWHRCLQLLEEECPERDLNLWLRPLHAETQGDNLRLLAPNRFVMKEVQLHFLPRIQDIMASLTTAPDFKLSLALGTGAAYQPDTSKFSSGLSFSPLGNHINPNNLFENFVEGSSNRMARASAMLIADHPGGQYNPLFIYGDVGLGKTHLTQAIANRMLQEDSSRRIAYVQAERFVGEMIRALQQRKIDVFKHNYRSLDALLIDDIQFFANKERSQEEFFYTFNTLIEGQHQIILTSDRYPKEINGLEERLKSRFGWGLIAAIDPPELETRVLIVQQKAKQQGVLLPDPVAFFLAQRISSNVRELEGALRRVIATAHFTSRPISIELARMALKDLLAIQQKLVSIENIQRTVANYFRIRPSDLSSKSRSRSITRPRQIAMSLSKELTRHSLPEIGLAFGGRDHSTVLHACRKVSELRFLDTQINDDYQNLLRLLSG